MCFVAKASFFFFGFSVFRVDVERNVFFAFVAIESPRLNLKLSTYGAQTCEDIARSTSARVVCLSPRFSRYFSLQKTRERAIERKMV